MDKILLSSRQAGKIIRCNPQKVRDRIKAGIWTFGTRIPSRQTGKKSDDYEINRYKLANFLSISNEELERRLNEGDKKSENP